jgi:hypothetical protein
MPISCYLRWDDGRPEVRPETEATTLGEIRWCVSSCAALGRSFDVEGHKYGELGGYRRGDPHPLMHTLMGNEAAVRVSYRFYIIASG